MRRSTFCRFAIAALLGPALYSQSAALTNIYTFQGATDGGQPNGGLVADSSGSLYGVTKSGGTGAGGTVFKMTPPTVAGGSWTYSVLYDFVLSSGEYQPNGPLVFGPDGSLYGTTISTVFSLTPPIAGGGSWTKTTLYTFNANRDGNTPGPITLGHGGILYGVLTYPGARQSGFGSVYQLRRDASGVWHEKALVVFTDNNAAYPSGILAVDSNGALYGTCEGTQTFVYPGSVYQLVPPAVTGAPWTYNKLYNFSLQGTDGLSPIGGVIFGLNGALYGTTAAGGVTGNGAVFELAPPSAPGGTWTETILYNFTGGSDGAFPAQGLVTNKVGTLFGIAEYGGAQTSYCQGCGTTYALKPPAAGGSWSFELLHQFLGGPDGQNPAGPLLLGKGGLFGMTTGYQNPVNAGTVYQLTETVP